MITMLVSREPRSIDPVTSKKPNVVAVYMREPSRHRVVGLFVPFFGRPAGEIPKSALSIILGHRCSPVSPAITS